MMAMQYTIQLPGDFDASLIRARVEERRELFDDLPGMMHKSFLFNEADKLYAPFYIWQHEEAAREFLLNDLFRGVIRTFSRPRVRHWHVLGTGYGNRKLVPGYAVREADVIPSEEPLQDLVSDEKDKQQALLSDPNVYFSAIALDAERWELVRYTVWSSEERAAMPDADCVQTYEVLHVSDPADEANQPVRQSA